MPPSRALLRVSAGEFLWLHFNLSNTASERWLRALVNRVDPLLFGRCFESWIAALWPNHHRATSPG